MDSPAPVNTVVDCVACHNSVTAAKDSVVMPSGIELTGLGGEARCMECHQARIKVSVDAAIANAAVDDGAVSADLGFRNIHYYAAAATKYGTLAQGGYGMRATRMTPISTMSKATRHASAVSTRIRSK